MSENEVQKKESKLERTFPRPLIRGLPVDVPDMSLENLPPRQSAWESFKQHPYIPLGILCASLLVIKAARGFKTRRQVVRDPADYIVEWRVPIQATLFFSVVLEMWNSGCFSRSKGNDK